MIRCSQESIKECILKICGFVEEHSISEQVYAV